MPETRSYTPPAGHHFLTPLYDVGVRLSTRETVWRSALVELMSPKEQDVLLDIGAGTGSLAPLSQGRTLHAIWHRPDRMPSTLP